MKNIKITVLFILFSKFAFTQQTKSFQWIGGPTYVLQLGNFKILTDPMLCAKSDTAFVIKKHPTTGALNAYIARFAEPGKLDTNNIDLLLISHLHADHFDNEAKNILNKNLKTIVPANNKETILNWGFYNVTGLRWRDTLTFKKSNETLTIISVRALHAGDESLNAALGEVNGYIIAFNDGKKTFRIYWTGDTVWFDEIRTYNKYGSIDLFIPNVGAVGADGNIGRRGLNAKETIKIIKELKPKRTIPVHHSTFSHYVEPVQVLKDLAGKEKLNKRINVLKENATIRF
jgi:N-acyl-phosphatidylethanolamine-hydrolysing phospholipase D